MKITNHRFRIRLGKPIQDERSPNKVMFNVTAVIAQAVGKVARWLAGCECHRGVLKGIRDPKKRRAVLRDLGLTDGFCCWAGRRGPALALGQ
jgi:hypothetical protein